jgi:predicted metal-dependent HD superfamily phosphohydrolase
MSSLLQENDTLFQNIRALVWDKLDSLNPNLTYHNKDHTMDVVKQCERIARDEGVEEGRELFLLKVAALYHDTGFLKTYFSHEEMSCRIFMEDAVLFKFSDEDNEMVKSLIMATKLPQAPKTLLEKIICDEDLDYLGRAEFFTIGEGLRTEFVKYSIIHSEKEWNELQVKFLSSHHYHTESSRRCREDQKQANIARLP